MAGGGSSSFGEVAGKQLLTQQANQVTNAAVDQVKKRKRRFTTTYTSPLGVQDTAILNIPTLGGGAGNTLLGQ